MSKFRKRITKSMSKPLNDSLVIGNAFGYIDEVLKMYNTVFLFGNDVEVPKAKNLVHRTSIEVAYNMPHITAIFVDENYIDCFGKLVPILNSASPDLFVQGNEVVPKTETKDLYKNGYRAVKQLGWCHKWSRIA